MSVQVDVYNIAREQCSPLTLISDMLFLKDNDRFYEGVEGEEGAFVFITGRRQDELDKAVKQIGRNVMGVQGDVSNLADLDRLYDTVKQQKGRIDVLFENAGIAEFVPLEISFDKIFSVNVKRAFYQLCRKKQDVECKYYIQ